MPSRVSYGSNCDVEIPDIHDRFTPNTGHGGTDPPRRFGARSSREPTRIIETLGLPSGTRQNLNRALLERHPRALLEAGVMDFVIERNFSRKVALSMEEIDDHLSNRSIPDYQRTNVRIICT